MERGGDLPYQTYNDDGAKEQGQRQTRSGSANWINLDCLEGLRRIDRGWNSAPPNPFVARIFLFHQPAYRIRGPLRQDFIRLPNLA
jgi:hypothetical protein